MRDYDLEEFLIHYGTPGMKRPSGLKYKTNGGSTSLWQKRRAMMYGNGHSGGGGGRIPDENGHENHGTALDKLNDRKNGKKGKAPNKSLKDFMEEGAYGNNHRAKNLVKNMVNNNSSKKTAVDMLTPSTSNKNSAKNMVETMVPNYKKKKKSSCGKSSWKDY